MTARTDCRECIAQINFRGSRRAGTSPLDILVIENHPRSPAPRVFAVTYWIVGIQFAPGRGSARSRRNLASRLPYSLGLGPHSVACAKATVKSRQTGLFRVRRHPVDIRGREASLPTSWLRIFALTYWASDISYRVDPGELEHRGSNDEW